MKLSNNKSPSKQKQDPERSTFYLEPTEQNTLVAKEARLDVFSTQQLIKLNSDHISIILKGWFKQTRYVFNSQTIEINTDCLVMEDLLDVLSNITIFVKVTFSDEEESVDCVAGRLLTPDTTTVRQGGNIVRELLPGNPASVPGHSLDIFRDLTAILQRNLEREEGKALLLSVLLCGEDGSGRVELTRRVAGYLGLDHKETHGRDLIGETTAITEANIVKVVREVRSRVPAVWVLRFVSI